VKEIMKRNDAILFRFLLVVAIYLIWAVAFA